MSWLSKIFGTPSRVPEQEPQATPVNPVPQPKPVLQPRPAPQPPSTSLRDRLAKQLRRDEGEVLHAYQAHLGYWTIGIGRLIDKRKGGGISPEESAYLFGNDLTERLEEVGRRIPWIHRLDEARQGVLINMSFQIGVDGLLEFKNTLAMVERGDYEGAARGMGDSLWAREQTPERAERLVEQMRTGIWQ